MVYVSVNSPTIVGQAIPTSMLYQEKVTQFELTLVSSIKIESLYRSGVKLNRDHRTADVKIFSNVDFSVQRKNQADEDKDYDFLKHKVNKSDPTGNHPNEYYLTITVPREITHNFQTNLILVHPMT